MKKLRLRLAAATLRRMKMSSAAWFVLLVLATAAAAGETRMQVIAGSAPVYARPDGAAASVGTVASGQILFVARTEGEWAAISPPESIDLWLNKDFIEGNRVIAKSIQVRAGPGIQYDVVGTLERGAPVMPRGEEGDWCKIAPPSSATLWVKLSALSEVVVRTEPVKAVAMAAAPAPSAASPPPSEPSAASAPPAAVAPPIAPVVPAPAPTPPEVQPTPAAAPSATAKIAPSTPEKAAPPAPPEPRLSSPAPLAPIPGAATPRPVAEPVPIPAATATPSAPRHVATVPSAPVPSKLPPPKPGGDVRPAAATTVAPAAPSPAVAKPTMARPAGTTPTATAEPAAPPPARRPPAMPAVTKAVPAPASAVVAQKPKDAGIKVAQTLVDELDLADLPGQGKPVQVEGELRNAPFMTASPSRYRLVDEDEDGMIEMVCHVHGDSGVLRDHIGKQVSIRGREYWVEESDMPVVVVGQIVPLAPANETVAY